MTTIADLAAATRRYEVEAEQRAAAAAEKGRRADDAATKAQALRDAAEADTAATRDTLAGQFMAIMRTLTGEVAAARKVALHAARTGEGDVLALWLEYRRTRARNIGTWRALRVRYEQTTGRRPPPGAWGPELVPDVRGENVPVPPETFADFLTVAMAQVERDLHGQAHDQAWSAVVQPEPDEAA